jgi:environmental stress-induced protein Ves
MQIIEPGAWRSQPWRNGAGVTHELVRWPGGDPDDAPFAVRISVAEISAPAPFSAFAGHRRWLYLLDGGPVTLVLDGVERALAAPGDGVAFAGAATAAAIAVARPSRDLNFMVREPRPARAELLRGGDRRALAGAAVAVFAIAGELDARGDGGAARRLGRDACAWSAGGRIDVELAEGAIAAALIVG